MTSNAKSSSQGYLPVEETPAELYIERTNFNALPLEGYLCGIEFVLTVIALHYLVTGKPWRKVEWGMVIYTMLLFTGSTIYMAAGSQWAENMFINDRNYPGGPVGYYVAAYNTPLIVVGNAAYIFNSFLSDGLLMYRTWIVYDRNWLIVAFPLLTFAGSTAMSILATYQLAQPTAQFFSHTGLSLTLPYFSLSIALNLILTLMIATKLLLARRHLMSILGKEHAQIYVGVVAMMVRRVLWTVHLVDQRVQVESAALYAVFSVMFIATYPLNNSLFNDCLAIQAQIMCIAPLLIMIRVARGRAYSQEAIASLQTSKVQLEFVHPGTTVTEVREVSNVNTLNGDEENVSASKIICDV
ncbi:hypothetical protein AURDEDRAFT_173048 [Auricularia subglabra TFB-10046 SS5]|uniref:RTA1-domain-containing protein n=1 Tax=Auricularia subglabra (strain TFB-10046 / SS5) TaxID=717982 RepID=J0WWI7_AURST|nr:hypothetical protein AURDEDRAFT_173048 [Auricularia subglabra TFB-10046 SS5]